MLRNGYGDCKDHAALFQALLAAKVLDAIRKDAYGSVSLVPN